VGKKVGRQVNKGVNIKVLLGNKEDLLKSIGLTISKEVLLKGKCLAKKR